MQLPRLMLAFVLLLAAPYASEGFSTSSLALRASVAAKASNRISSLRMSSEPSEDGEGGQKLNRAAKRMQEKASKKGVDGKAKTMTQAAGGMRQKRGEQGKTPVKAKLIEVMNVDDLPSEEGARKSVEIKDTNPQRIVMMMRHKGQILAVNPGCTKCKFPLLGADYQDGKNIRCKVCGSTWKLPNGEVIEGTEGTMMSGLFSATPQTALPIFATKTMGNKIYMGIAL